MRVKKNKQPFWPELLVAVVLLIGASALVFTGIVGYVVVPNLGITIPEPTVYLSPNQISHFSGVTGSTGIADNDAQSYTTLLFTDPTAFWCPSGFTTSEGRCRFQGEQTGPGDADVYFRGWVKTRDTFKKLDGSNQVETLPTAQKIQVVYSDYGTGSGPEGYGMSSKFHIFANLRCASEPSAPLSYFYVGECTVRNNARRETCTKTLGVECNHRWTVGEIILTRADLSDYVFDPVINDVKLVRQYTCSDTDYGRNSIDKGRTTFSTPSGSISENEDTCTANSNQVSEYYCNALTGNSPTIHRSTTITCPRGTLCQDAKCVPQLPAASDYTHYPSLVQSESSSSLSGGLVGPDLSTVGAILEHTSIDQNGQEIPLSCPAGSTNNLPTGCTINNKHMRGWIILDLTSDSSVVDGIRNIKVATAGLPWSCTNCGNYVSKVHVFTSPSVSNPTWTHRQTCSVNHNQVAICNAQVSTRGTQIEGILIARSNNPGNDALDPTVTKVWTSTTT